MPGSRNVSSPEVAMAISGSDFSPCLHFLVVVFFSHLSDLYYSGIPGAMCDSVSYVISFLFAVDLSMLNLIKP